MSEDLVGSVEGGAVHYQVGGHRMAQIVESEILDPRLEQRGIPEFAKLLGSLGLLFGREDQAVTDLPEPPQFGHGGFRQRAVRSLKSMSLQRSLRSSPRRAPIIRAMTTSK